MPESALDISGDRERTRSVYKYLLYLTDPNLATSKLLEKPNESKIAEQWGDNRIFIRRVLRSVFPELYPEEKNERPPLPGLTLGRLIKIISSLQSYWNSQLSSSDNDRMDNYIISREKKYHALNLFTQLIPEERKEIGLAEHPGEALIQQMLEIATDPVKGLGIKEINNIYEQFLRQELTANKEANKEFKQDQEKLLNDDLIKYTIIEYFRNLYQTHEKEIQSSKIEDYLTRVKREISRIEFQSGLKQIEIIYNNQLKPDLERKYNKYLSPEFIQRLTFLVLDNQIINDDFPIYLKYYNIEKISPLPLYVKNEYQKNGLLNPDLLEEDEDLESISGLERQFVYKAKVHFYIKLYDDYQPKLKCTEINTLVNNERRLEFIEEITGIGSPISLVVAAINRVLLRDIPVLKEYFYIVHEKINSVELTGGSNSNLVWSHTLVELCKNEDIEKSIKSNQPYSQLARSIGLAYGEYCGFDLVEVATKSALYARLRAIKKTGINPREYLQHICNRVEEENAINISKNLINYYPFSLIAMEGAINDYLLNINYRSIVKSKDNIYFKDDLNKPWSMVAYAAHLEITEAYLKEGLYRVAKKYLEVMISHIETYGSSIISDLMLARYYLCRFRYCYLYDLNEDDREFSDRNKAVRAALSYLNDAEKCLRTRVEKLYCIDQVEQSNFNPFFFILSRIYEHRAKLYMFFGSYMPSDPNKDEDNDKLFLKPIQLFEKARIYAARDGNSDIYSCNSAYQSWCYLRLAFSLENGDERKLEYINWAKRLVDHAKLCYSRLGKKCYQDIKNNSGKIDIASLAEEQVLLTYETFDSDSFQIKGLPVIQELQHTDELMEFYDRKKQVLYLDFSILKHINQKNRDKSIYLFGPHSSIILFAMGLLEVCEEVENDQQILINVKSAMRKFYCSSVIAMDGGTKDGDNNSNHKICLSRIFENDGNPDSLLRGLYIHRLTQFADFGNIFRVACHLILIINSYIIENSKDMDKQLDEVKLIIKSLIDNNNFTTIESNLGQKRYNGHFADHYKNLERYFNNLTANIAKHTYRFKKSNESLPSIVGIRNRIIVDFFRILSGMPVDIS
ncbi:hypothetical protein [Pseudanabaena sp. PCC 6802]|uniref:hypothetical protein n=1 Tax=Pseudanabaena sp. PCC 6802 TaxID=118173 RepID=UPI00034A9E73|nr:hypothetical protein [Pseudanabaena sp. PCC 6802]